MLPRPQECFLYDVLRALTVAADQSLDKTEQRAAVLRVKRADEILVGCLADTHTKSYAAGPRGGSDANGRLTAYTRRAERLLWHGDQAELRRAGQ